MYQITVQHINRKTKAPTHKKLKMWATHALKKQIKNAELTIRIVNEKEIKKLNSTYRNKLKSTNVLSFPMELPKGILLEIPPLGDIVICSEIVEEEAKNQKKNLSAHWAHMVIHGTLHLLGYDHEKNHEAEIMEKLEIRLLKKLGYKNPYEEKKEK